MNPTKKELFDAVYRDTRYRVFHPKGSFDLEIDMFNEACKLVMEINQAKTAAFITSQNPHSIQHSPQENELVFQQFTKIISLNYHFFPASGIPNHTNWPEEKSLFILSIPFQEVLRIAIEYRQNAFLFVNTDFTPKLIWVEEFTR
ncbi:MAG: DUF3293 domain-containing protein [Chloroherpetonaceae bacterium]|nr:DUF3293 domain-containing protein [Chloroherpetonaceae bacterium]